nr:rna polymerase-associated protein [Quercus suber]
MSDDGLDAELLGMVGDGSDDEGEEMESPQQVQSPALSAEAKESVEQVEDPQATRKGVAQKVRAKGGRKRRKAQSDDEDDFGDEPSPSPPQSLGSGAMDESDADAPASPDAEVNLYPLEGRYMNTTDREEILAMPEIKREAILAERQEEIMKKQQNMALKRALANAQGVANKYNKRKAAAAELDDGGRRTTRPKAEKTATTALDNYKKAREAKGNDRTRSEPGRGRRDDRRSSSSDTERDADGESEVEWAAEPSAEQRRGEEPAADLKDFERCRIGRSNFAKVCFYPAFEDAVRGCFARVSIGLNRETGQNQYRMTQIKGLTDGKPYHMEGPNGKQFVTDQYAVVAHGMAEKAWPFSACSDSRFTDAEYDRWTSTLQKENLPLVSRKKLNLKLQDIHNLLNIQWTDAAITEKLARQKDMEKKCDPVNVARIKKEAILKRKDEAEHNGDADEVAKCDAELVALENANLNGHANIKVASDKPMKEQDRLALVNQRNRNKNSEEIRRALIQDKKRLHAARAAAGEAARLKIEAAAAEKARLEAKASGDDLFGEDGESDMNSTGRKTKGGANTSSNGIKKEHSGLGLRKKAAMDDDILGSMDFGIDIEI